MIFERKIQQNKGKKGSGITLRSAVTVLVRLAFFLLYPALFSTAFTGVKMIIMQMTRGADLPWNSFVVTLIILLVVTILFGRIFCGFACAFGTYGDFIYYLSCAVRKKMKKRPFHVFEKAASVLKYLKYIVLAGVLILCILGRDSLVSLHSPFSAFSRVYTLKTPESRIGLVLLVLITIGMAAESRFFCRFLCPMGAIFSLMPVLPWSVIKRDRDNCIPNCRACKMACPAALDIPSTEEGDNSSCGECFSCGKCIKRCPRQNIRRIS